MPTLEKPDIEIIAVSIIEHVRIKPNQTDSTLGNASILLLIFQLLYYGFFGQERFHKQ